MTIPNLLSVARIFLTALLAWLLLRQSMTAAFIVFFIAGLTDALDGLLARVLDQKSRLGSYIDPVADKLLLVTAFFLLWKIGEIPFWLLLIIAGRDLVILCGFFVLYFSQVQFEVKPLVSSKLTTLFQLGTVFTLLGRSFLELSGWIYSVLFVTTAGFSILSGGQYLLKGLSLLKRHRSGNTAQ
ncbi:MAG TPA: CDP-alcohol phosphatidyltransferase family protein [Deltaproteobacteria bacterium]|jgi:cardiolipin synthase|nr:CDP-alcohol phosphatidyltransferase family protein [Deltaproteobacteria bacterium]